MAITLPPISFKKSNVSGSQPSPASLEVGEIAINLADKKIFTKDFSGNIISIGGGASDNVDSDIRVFLNAIDFVLKSDFDSDFGVSLASRTTDDLDEGLLNKYYKKINVDSDINQILDIKDYATHSDVDSDIQVALLGVPGLVDTINNIVSFFDSDSELGTAILLELNGKFSKDSDTTDDIIEGTNNLFYTKTRVDSDINDFINTSGFAKKTEVDSDFIIIQNKLNNEIASTDSDITLLQAKILHNKQAADSDIFALSAVAIDSELRVLGTEVKLLKEQDSDFVIQFNHNKLATDSDLVVLANADSDLSAKIDSNKVDTDSDILYVKNLVLGINDSDLNVKVDHNKLAIDSDILRINNRINHDNNSQDSEVLVLLDTYEYMTADMVDSEISVAITGTGGVLQTIQEIQALLDSDSDLTQGILVSLSNKVDKISDTTDDLNEGTTNLYYTKARVDSDIAEYLGGADLGGPDSDWVLNNAAAGTQIFFTQMQVPKAISVNTSNLTRWYAPETIEIVSIKVLVETMSAGANITLNFQIDGTTWLTKSITFNSTTISVLPVKEVSGGSYLTVAIPNVSGSCSNMAVIFRYRLKV